MQRYFAYDKKDNLLLINKEDLYHIKTVMRMQIGDKIEVVYDNKLFLGKLDDSYNALVIEELEIYSKKLKTILCIPLLTEQKMSFVLQKATELGVDIIVPVITKRSVVKLDLKEKEKKINRWYKICKEASEQSKRIDIPQIYDITKLEDLKFDGVKIVCSTIEKSNSLKTILKDKKINQITLVVGPEGGLDKIEEETLIKLGFTPITLGQTILRVETVPISTLSIINYEMME